MFKDSTSLKVGALEELVALVELPPVLLAYEDIEKNTDTRESKSSRWKRKGVCDASYMGNGLHE